MTATTPTPTTGGGAPTQPEYPCTCAKANAFLRSYGTQNTDGCTVATQNCDWPGADFSAWSCSYDSSRRPQYVWSCTDAGDGSPPSDATETIVLTLTASGSVSDYSDTTALRRSIAASAGVDPSSTVITVAPASVIITATITVPASTAAEVQTSLASSLGTAAAASAALGITVESAPTITTSSPAPKDLTGAGASNVEGDSDSNSTGGIIGGVGERNAPCSPAPPQM